MADRHLSSSSSDDLLACCERIADAHAAQDPQQATLGLVDLYRHLTDQGWAAPPRAVLALQLHAAAVDAGLNNLLAPRPGLR